METFTDFLGKISDKPWRVYAAVAFSKKKLLSFSETSSLGTGNSFAVSPFFLPFPARLRTSAVTQGNSAPKSAESFSRQSRRSTLSSCPSSCRVYSKPWTKLAWYVNLKYFLVKKRNNGTLNVDRVSPFMVTVCCILLFVKGRNRQVIIPAGKEQRIH